jgi:hypothetical protein
MYRYIFVRRIPSCWCLGMVRNWARSGTALPSNRGFFLHALGRPLTFQHLRIFSTPRAEQIGRVVVVPLCKPLRPVTFLPASRETQQVAGSRCLSTYSATQLQCRVLLPNILTSAIMVVRTLRRQAPPSSQYLDGNIAPRMLAVDGTFFGLAMLCVI